MIALIAVSAAVYAIDRPYSYRIPAGMALQAGVRVMVPFGRSNRHCEGVVLALEQGDTVGLKAIEAVLDETPVLSEGFLRLAAFVRERYFCTYYDAIKAMLPAGLWFAASEYFELTEDAPEALPAASRKPLATDVLRAVRELGGRGELSRLRQQFPEEEPLQDALRYLVRKRYLRSNMDLSKRMHDKTEQIASLAVPAEEAMAYAQRRKSAAPLQYEVLKLLSAIGSGSTKEIGYLTGATPAVFRRLAAMGFIDLSSRPVFRRPAPAAAAPAEPLVLNEEQESVFQSLKAQAAAEKPGVALLYGVTGSGKTAVYLRLIRSVLDRGKTALLLVPEISLTPQLLRHLAAHFGDTVAVLHSALRVSERYDEWKRIRQGCARVVVGTRSAVFAPLENLGLLILDEEQEHTYKSENTPRYHAREVAMCRGSREGALVLLGSATPSLETMYHAKRGDYRLYTLQTRYNRRALPQVELVDMKEELRQGNGGALSAPLCEAIQEASSAGRQSILFLNRRGAGRCLICVDCGEVPTCPRCSVSLTYHMANHRLMCHYCGYSQIVPDRCPQCGGHLKPMGVGTQKLEEELKTRFPDLPVLRMDADTVSAANSHEMILERFRKERIPILVGTQMVAKGLDFENVTLVGVVDADQSLYVDHYRAAETTFSMLTQVVGRAGRGLHPGRAIVQTMTPEHSVLQLAAEQNYDRFYGQEITLRQLHQRPPFADLFTIQFSGQEQERTLAGAMAFRQRLDAALAGGAYGAVRVLGPAPASIAKLNNKYRFRLILACVNRRPIRQLLAWLLQEFAKDKRQKGITVFADVNSYE